MATGSSSPEIEPEQRARIERAQQLANLIQQSSVTEVAHDRTLTVTVGPGNMLTALELTQQALRHAPSRLSDLIVDTTARATERLTDQLRIAAAELGHVDDTDVADVVDVVQGGLPEPAAGQVDDVPVPREFATLVAEDDDAPEMPAEWADRVPTEQSDGPMAKLEQMEQAATRQAARYAEVYEQLRTMTATASSVRALVTATVGQGNVLRRLDFARGAFRHGPKHLAGFILSAVHQANAELSQRSADMIQDGMEPALDIRALVEPYLPDDSEPTEGLTPDGGARR